jgi:glycosyltransferase involved in cell wall biosynthesis
MDERPLISVVMPAFNAASTIHEAISSVQAQSWTNWELLVVDNASTDSTAAIVSRFLDPRIKLLHESQKGVGNARNAALKRISGSFYCFFDADDILPETSLAIRAALLLNDPNVHFADGAVQAFDEKHQHVWTRTPTYRGPDPLSELLNISGSCFIGPTWMIRRHEGPIQLFRTDMTHAEDLLYFMCIAHRGSYEHTSDPVLYYRVGHVSAMSDLEGLHRGYRQLILAMFDLIPTPATSVIQAAWRKVCSIMFRSYLKRGRLLAALKALREAIPA